MHAAARHHVDLDAAPGRTNEPLEDHGILVPLVLNEKRMFRFVDEVRDAVRPLMGHQSRWRYRPIERRPVPVRLEARHDLIDLVPMIRDDRVVTGRVRFFVSQLSD